jgi:hypothetical protein
MPFPVESKKYWTVKAGQAAYIPAVFASLSSINRSMHPNAGDDEVSGKTAGASAIPYHMVNAAGLAEEATATVKSRPMSDLPLPRKLAVRRTNLIRIASGSNGPELHYDGAEHKKRRGPESDLISHGRGYLTILYFWSLPTLS